MFLLLVDENGPRSRMLVSNYAKFTEHLVATGGPVDSAQCYQIVLQRIPRFPAFGTEHALSVRVSGSSKISHLLDLEMLTLRSKMSSTIVCLTPHKFFFSERLGESPRYSHYEIAHIFLDSSKNQCLRALARSFFAELPTT